MNGQRGLASSDLLEVEETPNARGVGNSTDRKKNLAEEELTYKEESARWVSPIESYKKSNFS